MPQPDYWSLHPVFWPFEPAAMLPATHLFICLSLPGAAPQARSLLGSRCCGGHPKIFFEKKKKQKTKIFHSEQPGFKEGLIKPWNFWQMPSTSHVPQLMVRDPGFHWQTAKHQGGMLMGLRLPDYRTVPRWQAGLCTQPVQLRATDNFRARV